MSKLSLINAMSTPPKKPTWLASVIAIAAFLAASLAASVLTRAAISNNSAQLWYESDAASIERADEMLLSEPGIADLKQHFPEVYNSFRDASLDDVRDRTLSPQQIRTRAFYRARTMTVDLMPHIEKAPTESVIRVLETELRLIEALERQDVTFCAAFFMSGLRPEFELNSQSMSAVREAASARIVAAAAGRSYPTRRDPVSEADFEALSLAFEKAGGSEQEWSDLIDQSINRASPETQCRTGLVFYRALASLDADRGARLTVFLQVEAAKILDRSVPAQDDSAGRRGR